jgi:AcrR family transcriptional regulator
MSDRAPIREGYQRARSEAEKEDRRRKILDTAETTIADYGLEQLTMGALAEQAGISKGTLYLYFESKQAVLHELFERHYAAWRDRLIARIEPGMSDADFCAVFFRSTRSDSFLDSDVPLADPIEADASAHADMMSRVQESIRPLAQHIERCLGIAPGAGGRVVIALWALLLGARSMGPRLAGSPDPTELRAKLDRLSVASGEELFLQHGPAIVSGIRES